MGTPIAVPLFSGISATEEELNQAADLSNRYKSLTAAYTVLPEDNGKTFGLNLAGGFTVTMPAVATVPGFRCTFRVETNPTTAYIITELAASDTNICVGDIWELEVDTTNDGPRSTGTTFTNFVASVAVIGDTVVFEGNGTNWFISGFTNADGGVTLT